MVDKINARNTTPMAVARVLCKEENESEEEFEDDEGNWVTINTVVKTEPGSPVKKEILEQR